MDATEILAFIAFCLFAAAYALALRFAPDSRDALRAKEQDLAAYGLTWNELRDRS